MREPQPDRAASRTIFSRLAKNPAAPRSGWPHRSHPRLYRLPRRSDAGRSTPPDRHGRTQATAARGAARRRSWVPRGAPARVRALTARTLRFPPPRPAQEPQLPVPRAAGPHALGPNGGRSRLKKRARSLASRRPTALETVAFESCNSSAVRAKERNSTTFAKMARPSRSGSFATLSLLASLFHRVFETMGFQSFSL